jgi:hypothetical protein
VVLPKSGFIAGRADGFGIFERWILRLGYFTSRRSGPDALRDDLVVYLHPSRSVSREYRSKLIEYVRSGGHILVLDSAENRKSTANSLLRPFGITVKHLGGPYNGVVVSEGWPAISAENACEVGGGAAFSKLGDKVVGARVMFGRGSVTAIGYGARFTDSRMGVTGDVEPDETMRQVYEVEYRLLRWIIEGRPATTQATESRAQG